MAPKFDVSTPKGLAALNGYISSRSYIEGYNFSSADVEVFEKIQGAPDKTSQPHAYRWFIHIAALVGLRSLNFGGAATGSAGAPAAEAAPAKGGKAPASPKKAQAAAAPATAPAAKGDDDDDDDLFGDDDEEEEAKPKAATSSRAEQMAAAKKAKDANKKVDRSQVVIEVKPWEAEQDLVELFNKIQEVKVDGLNWGEGHKLVPVAFGVKKLVISCVIEDEKVGMEDITDAIEQFSDDVQSVDITSMNRL